MESQSKTEEKLKLLENARGPSLPEMAEQQEVSNLQTAMSYLDRGLSVIPLWSPEMLRTNPPSKFRQELKRSLQENEESGSPKREEEIEEELMIRTCKTPCIRSWKEYQHRLPTKEEVDHWFTTNPSANIGIITGEVSGIVVFDLDSLEAEQYAEALGGFPKTVKVKTPKGMHAYIKHPGFDISNKVNRELAIDIRADGGYVVAPPSIHGSGNHYRWEEGCSVYEREPAECSVWMVDYLKGKPANASTRPSDERQLGRNEDRVQNRKNPFVDILQKGRGEGERNDVAARLAGHLLKSLGPDESWEILKAWNESRNTPRMEESELRRTFDSVLKIEAANHIKISSLLDTPSQVVSEYVGNYVRIPFGGKSLPVMETKMNGGLIGGRLYLLGGIPSSGKTVLMNCMADNICLNGHPVLIFNYDDGKAELRSRTFARFSKFSIEDLNSKSLTTKELEGITEIAELKLIQGLKYVVEKMIPVEGWDELIGQIRDKYSKGPVVFIDYLRKLRTKKKTTDERLRVDDIVGKLTDLAKKENVPVVAISELARDSYKSGQRLSLASFKESGTIEYEASWAGILAPIEERNGEYCVKDNWERIIQQDGNVDLIVFKCKRGTGTTGKIPLKVDRNNMLVRDREDFHNPDTVSRTGRKSRFDWVD